jgi:hypothetical protein
LFWSVCTKLTLWQQQQHGCQLLQATGHVIAVSSMYSFILNLLSSFEFGALGGRVLRQDGRATILLNGIVSTEKNYDACLLWICTANAAEKLGLFWLHISPLPSKCAMMLYHHHHHISIMELGHMLARSGLTCPEISSKVCLGSFCQSGSSVLLPWVIYYEAFCLHVSSFCCILVICPKLELFLTPLQLVYLFCNLSKCIMVFFSCTSSLLLIFC